MYKEMWWFLNFKLKMFYIREATALVLVLHYELYKYEIFRNHLRLARLDDKFKLNYLLCTKLAPNEAKSPKCDCKTFASIWCRFAICRSIETSDLKIQLKALFKKFTDSLYLRLILSRFVCENFAVQKLGPFWAEGARNSFKILFKLLP